ncbi:MAG TPA: dephospho-CoA kinase [Pyrinomonadaceae bacterium]|nr:dephospho-CoA kinase [Pyrinomonadaceae bacterium]
MLRVGLTGSIAVGKSFVTSVLSELGCRTIDADAIAREVVAPGSPGLAAVVAAFGATILTAEGTLDRKRLGEVVFSDESRRKQLNSILHPLIIARQDELLRKWELEEPEGVTIVDAALMIESRGFRRFDKIIVVHCRPEVQLQRVMKRDGLSREAAEKKISSQMSQEEKLKFADYRIDTSAGFEDTRRQTEELYKHLQSVAKVESKTKP